MDIKKSQERGLVTDWCKELSSHTIVPLGWHTGMVLVGEVQPTPIPMKPIPAAGFTCTHTMNLQVLGNTVGTHKPMWVCHYFFNLTCTLFVFFCFLFCFLCWISI